MTLGTHAHAGGVPQRLDAHAAHRRAGQGRRQTRELLRAARLQPDAQHAHVRSILPLRLGALHASASASDTLPLPVRAAGAAPERGREVPSHVAQRAAGRGDQRQRCAAPTALTLD